MCVCGRESIFKCIKTLFYVAKVKIFVLFTVTFIVSCVLYLNPTIRVELLKSIFNESVNLKLTYAQQQNPVQHKFDVSKNRQWVLKQRPVGELTMDAFEFKVVDRPTITEGQVLVRHSIFSFDPVQKFWLVSNPHRETVPIGSPIEASAIGTVVESKNPYYEVGDVVATFGTWQDYAIYDAAQQNPGVPPLVVVPKGVSPYVFLTILTDFTAISGILRVGKIKAGDKVLVSGAAGATGSVAGQVAKLLGAALVVGIAGGKEKKQLLTSQFGFDIGIDYKSEDVRKRVNEIFGKTTGIDVYFDNVGGETLNIALGNISNGARIVLCGAISQYNTDESLLKVDLSNYFNLVLKGASMEGFMVLTYFEDLGVIGRWFYWQATGQLFRQIHIHKNFDNLPHTLIGLFQGSNIGKLVLENDT